MMQSILEYRYTVQFIKYRMGWVLHDSIYTRIQVYRTLYQVGWVEVGFSGLYWIESLSSCNPSEPSTHILFLQSVHNHILNYVQSVHNNILNYVQSVHNHILNYVQSVHNHIQNYVQSVHNHILNHVQSVHSHILNYVQLLHNHILATNHIELILLYNKKTIFFNAT